MMVVSNITSIYGICQQRGFRVSERVSRAEEEQRDYVALSTQAQDYQAIKNALTNEPDIRENRVNEIRQQIEAGNYNISSAAIADKMIADFYG